jgi:hypothetical protein
VESAVAINEVASAQPIKEPALLVHCVAWLTAIALGKLCAALRALHLVAEEPWMAHIKVCGRNIKITHPNQPSLWLV